MMIIYVLMLWMFNFLEALCVIFFDLLQYQICLVNCFGFKSLFLAFLFPTCLIAVEMLSTVF